MLYILWKVNHVVADEGPASAWNTVAGEYWNAFLCTIEALFLEKKWLINLVCIPNSEELNDSSSNLQNVSLVKAWLVDTTSVSLVNVAPYVMVKVKVVPAALTLALHLCHRCSDWDRPWQGGTWYQWSEHPSVMLLGLVLHLCSTSAFPPTPDPSVSSNK